MENQEILNFDEEEIESILKEMAEEIATEEIKKLDPQKIEYNTWLLKINIDNVESNYRLVKANCRYYYIADDKDLLHICKTEFNLYDTIIWKYVDWDKMREYFKDMYESE